MMHCVLKTSAATQIHVAVLRNPDVAIEPTRTVQTGDAVTPCSDSTAANYQFSVAM
jgi:hypothetical protein